MLVLALSFVSESASQPFGVPIPLKGWKKPDMPYRMQNDIPYFEYITDSKNRTYKTALEDRFGYLWVSTTNGIFRYDGREMIEFNYSEINSNGENNMGIICEDTIRNCVWSVFSDRKAMACISMYDNSYSEIELKMDSTTSKNNIVSLFNYSDSLLLGRALVGMVLVNKNSGKVYGPFSDNGLEKYNLAMDMFKNVNGEDYFTFDGSICKLEGRDPLCPHWKRLLKDVPRSLIRWDVVNDSVLAYTIKSDLYMFNLNTEQSTFMAHVPIQSIRTLTCMEDGIWIGGIRGMYFYKYETGEVYTSNVRNSMLRDCSYTFAFQSRKQPIVWWCTQYGLLKNDYIKSKFHFTDITSCCEANTSDLMMIYKDSRGGYWAWMNLDGLYHRTKDEYIFKKMDCEGFRGKKRVSHCLEDTVNHILYFCDYEKVMYYDDIKKQSGVLYQGKDKIRSIVFDYDENLLLVAPDRVLKYDVKTKQVKLELELEKDMGNLNTFAIESDSIFWMLSHTKVYTYNRNRKRFHFHATIDEASSNTTHIIPMVRNGIHEVWICCRKGLYYYLPAKRHLVKVEYCQMLTSPLKSMEVDVNNNIWVSTFDGIICIDNNIGGVYEYDHRKFAVDIKLGIGVSSVSKDGMILIGGVGGFIEFNSESCVVNDYYPSPVITGYRFYNAVSEKYDTLVNTLKYSQGDTIEVPAGVRSIGLDARILNFSEPERNMLQWRQENGEWTDIDTNTPIVLLNLGRGITKVQLRSLNSKGFPVGKIHNIYLDKQVFYYEHPLFHAGMGVTFLIIVIGVMWSRARAEEQQRIRLEEAVERQAGEIKKYNQELINNKAVIEQQNSELRIHRDHLEQQVAERTAKLQEAQMRAEENSRLKSAFLANLSHEVRTPMNCIVGFSKLLEDPACSRSEQSEFIHLIQESSQSMLVLIGDLLDVSRIESGQLRVNIKDFEVGREVYDVYRILSVERKNPNVQFELYASEQINGRILHSDKDRFRQIVINLSYNAFKFTEKGHVAIYADIISPEQLAAYSYPSGAPMPSSNELLLVRVEDTGIGIPADKTEVIFEPFRKLNNNKTLYPGLGLGLNIVKNLIRLLNGQIWLTSIEKHGTTFFFYLPFEEDLDNIVEENNK